MGQKRKAIHPCAIPTRTALIALRFHRKMHMKVGVMLALRSGTDFQREERYIIL